MNIETSPIQSKGLVSEEVAIDVLATNDVNAAMKVTSVRSMSGDSCQVTSMDEQSFTTSSDEVSECQRIHRRPTKVSFMLVRNLQLLVFLCLKPQLITHYLILQKRRIDTPVVIDLSQKLAEELDTSVFYLSSDASVLGTGIVDSDVAKTCLLLLLLMWVFLELLTQ
ncbi:hypothetical protein D0856_07890 [Vibrio owensii]|nr:hypothetical protein D0856_07890 [Vibrio owensii]